MDNIILKQTILSLIDGSLTQTSDHVILLKIKYDLEGKRKRYNMMSDQRCVLY